MVDGDLPLDWRARRNEVFGRDSYACQYCGEKGGEHGDADLIAYHLVPSELGGSHDTMNLVTLCRTCKGAIAAGEPGGGDGGAAAEEVGATSIDDMGDLRRAIAHLDKLENLVSRYAAQVLGEGDIDEGEIVRNYKSFRVDARDVKKHILTSKLMFTNMQLGADQEAQQQVYSKLTEQVLALLRYELEIVNRFLDFVDVLTTTKCPKCGYDADRDSKLCGECSRELPVHWECLQCRTDIDELDEDHCSACGNELPELPPEQQQELDAVREATKGTIDAWRSQLSAVLEVVQNDLVEVRN